MLAQKRLLAAILAPAALVLTTLMFAAPGSATAPYVEAATVSLSTTSPCPGESVTVTGTGFVPGSTVDLTLHTTVTSLGSAVVTASGGFTAAVTVPAGVTGTHQIVAAGPSTATNSNTAEATLHIRDCPVSPASPPGPPAITGVDILGMVALVVVLLGIGAAFVYIGRRRKSAA